MSGPCGALLLLLVALGASRSGAEVTQRPAFSLHTGTTGAPMPFLRAQCLTPRGRFPHPKDCSKFIDCWDGRALEKICPDGQMYSDLPGGFCDYREYVDCKDRPMPPFTTPTTAESANSTTEPPKGFTKLGSSAYLMSVSQASWLKARAVCQGQGSGSDLISLDTAEEEKMVIEWILKNDADKSSYWLGLNDMRTEGKFEWVSNQKAPSFLNWLQGEPNNAFPEKGGENCVQYAFVADKGGYKWMDVNCDGNIRFLCKWSSASPGTAAQLIVEPAKPVVNPALIPAPVPAPPQVPANFEKVGTGYYLLSSTAVNWASARSLCITQGPGSDLLTMDTLAEEQAVVEWITKKDSAKSDYWLGLNDLRTEGKFEWASTLQAPSYTNWHSGQPDNYKHDATGENCGHFTTFGAVYKWNDERCNTNRRYICKWTTPTPPVVPQGFTQLSTGYYMFSTNNLDLWNARATCAAQGRGSDIVAIETPEEDKALREEISKRDAATKGNGDFLMGLNDQIAEGQFIWESSKKPATFFNWNRGVEPNGGRSENCVVYWVENRPISDPNNIKWYDTICDIYRRYICEWSKPATARLLNSTVEEEHFLHSAQLGANYPSFYQGEVNNLQPLQHYRAAPGSYYVTQYQVPAQPYNTYVRRARANFGRRTSPQLSRSRL